MNPAGIVLMPGFSTAHRDREAKYSKPSKLAATMNYLLYSSNPYKYNRSWEKTVTNVEHFSVLWQFEKVQLLYFPPIDHLTNCQNNW